VRWKWGLGIVVVVAAAALVAVRFSALNDDLSEARARISALEDNLRYANETRFEGLADADERYRDLKNKMRSRLQSASRVTNKLERRLDDALCFNVPGREIEAGFFRGAVRGDVDGDAVEDVIHPLARLTRQGKCRYLLTVRTAEGFSKQVVHGDDEFGMEMSFGAGAIPDLNGVPGDEILVHLGSGAYAQIGQIFTVVEGDLLRVKGLGRRELWYEGASAGNGSLYDCLDPSGTEILRYEWHYGANFRGHVLTRHWYRVLGDQAVLYDRDRQRMRGFDWFDRFPQLSEGNVRAFRHC
jgi:hypothetical protein